MNVNGKHYRTIWLEDKEEPGVTIIDQRFLPHRFVLETIHSVEEMARALRDMQVRGAGLIGAAAGYGMFLAAAAADERSFEEQINTAAKMLVSTRPTAVNLSWAVKRVQKAMMTAGSIREKKLAAKQTALAIADEDAEYCRQIGLHGVGLLESIARKRNNAPVQVLTHCNAGWLAFVDHGSATAPVYEAWRRGIDLHVWVDETRPRNQGASLTAWELLNEGIPHTVITDNTGGHLMQQGLVDLVITGADRVTRCGDAANKIGTYLKALAAKDNDIPFYIALPSSTFDWNICDGVRDIEIEERHGDEVRFVQGLCEGEIRQVLVTPELSPTLNFGFDITPARLISGLITERGICRPEEKAIRQLYPEKLVPAG